MTNFINKLTKPIKSLRKILIQAHPPKRKKLQNLKAYQMNK